MKTFQQLLEGIYDPNIFKAVFLAGGPGSGKSYVVSKVVSGMGLKVINSDEPFERYLTKAGLSLKMPDEEQIPRDVERKKAKRVTGARKGHAIDGRLGMVIDGTGKDYDKITSQASKLQELGYETYMVFVNTTLETALERNRKRARSVPPNIAKQGWSDVQKNFQKFHRFFGNKMLVANNDSSDDKDILQMVAKTVSRAMRKPVNNPIAKAWIENELKKKQAKPNVNLAKDRHRGGGYVDKNYNQDAIGDPIF